MGTKHELLNSFRKMAGLPTQPEPVVESVEPIIEPVVEVQPEEVVVVEAEEQSTEWMKDKKLVQSIIDPVIDEMNKASAGKHDISVSGSPKVSPHRNTLYVSYPLKGDFGVFNFIVGDVSLDLQIQKRTDESGSFAIKAALHYDHHGRGSNGYDIGWFFLDDSMKIESKHTQLTMNNKRHARESDFN